MTDCFVAQFTFIKNLQQQYLNSQTSHGLSEMNNTFIGVKQFEENQLSERTMAVQVLLYIIGVISLKVMIKVLQ